MTERLTRALRVTIGLFSAGFVLVFLWIVARRITYPFDLEWLEGATLDHVERLREGRGIYVAPSPDFIPFMYNPLYYAVAVPFTWVFRGYVAIRVVSVASTLATFALLFAIIRRETHRWVFAALGVGVFAGSYVQSGGWFDVGRVDPLYVALCLGAVFAGRAANTKSGLFLCALLTALAFGTKQNAALLVPALTFGLARLHGIRRALLGYALPASGLILGAALALDVESGGWFRFYTFVMPMHHRLLSWSLVGTCFWRLVRPFPIAIAVGLYGVFGPRSTLTEEGRAYHRAALVGLVASALASRVHFGSYANDDMPAHAAFALAIGLGATAFDLEIASARARALRVSALLAGTLQLAVLVYDPRVWVPTASDRAEGERFLDALRAFPGDVYIPNHPRLARRVGKPSFASEMAVADLMRMDGDPRGVKETLRRAFKDLFESMTLSAVVTDGPFPFEDVLFGSYHFAPASFVVDQNAFVCRTGLPIRPLFLLVPNGRRR